MLVGAWYYTSVLRQEALLVIHRPPRPDAEVIEVEGGAVLLRDLSGKPGGAWAQPGTWGLEWDGGYAQAGDILDLAPQKVLRELTLLTGAPAPGQHVRFDTFAYPHNPRDAHGIGYREVVFESEAGQFPAWLVDGDRDTWVIVVHGKGADLGEPMRILPTLHRHGSPVLVISYRNDRGGPIDPSGYFRYGVTEWRDLEGAVEFALGKGARCLVLYGYSMGGSIALNFMQRSAYADRVAGLILDSPLLDFGQTVEERAKEQHAPPGVVPLGKVIARWRFGVDWGALNYRRVAEKLDVPVLLFHGAEDRDIPPGPSDELAETRPDIVRYHRVEGAAHVCGWNVDPAGYEAAVAGFLNELDANCRAGEESR